MGSLKKTTGGPDAASPGFLYIEVEIPGGEIDYLQQQYNYNMQEDRILTATCKTRKKKEKKRKAKKSPITGKDGGPIEIVACSRLTVSPLCHPGDTGAESMRLRP